MMNNNEWAGDSMSTEEINTLSEAIIKNCHKLLQQSDAYPEQLNHLLEQYSSINADMLLLASQLLSKIDKVWLSQINYWQEAFTLSQKQILSYLQGQSAQEAKIDDSLIDWQINTLYHNVMAQYLLVSTKIQKLILDIEFTNPRIAKRIQFFTQSFLDALNPSLFLHTNPKLQAQTLKHQGSNLLQGFHQLIQDFSKNPFDFSIPMTDMTAFKIGENLATTAGFVIYKNDFIELIQYSPQTEKVKAIPLLIIPPWINKYYILDLSPDNSWVSWLVQQGFSVFIISWVNPDARFSQKGLFDYLEQGPIKAIELIKKQLNVTQVNTAGFCLGGTLLACLVAYFAAHNNTSIRSATFLATLIDFTDPGDISIYIDEQQINSLEKIMNKKGFLPGQMMTSAFNSLRAKDLVWSFFVKNYIEGKSPVPFDILFWNADNTNMPAKMHSEYLRSMYLRNLLIQPEKMILNHTALNIERIHIPTYFVATEKDHIAPWQSVYQGFQAFHGHKTFILGGSGHIAGIVNPPNKKKYAYYSHSQYDRVAEKWHEQAQKHSGSWWPHYQLWLSKQSGRMIKARDISQMPITPIGKAPGTYVFTKTSDLTTSF